MAMDQKALESLSGPQQIIVLKSLKQEAAAWLLGVTARTLRDHSGEIERQADDSYDARAVVASGLSTGLLKVDPVELSPDEQEQCIRAAEFLTGDCCSVSPAIMRLIRGLEERYGDRGLAEFVRLVRETWVDDYNATESAPPMPSEAELRRELEEKLEAEIKSLLEGNTEVRLKRGVECFDCGKIRRGKQWVKAEKTEWCLQGQCPDCHDLEQQQRSRRKKRRPNKVADLAALLDDDDE